MIEEISRIKGVIDKFQEGYLNRDLEAINDVLDLFVDSDILEVIGTDAHRKGQGEWNLDKASLKKLIEGDWQGWGDLKLHTENLNIHVNGQTAWFATAGTVSQTLEPEQSYRNFLGYLKRVTEKEPGITAKEKLLDVLRGGIITLAEADKGARYIWPIRLTAVLIQDEGQWRFCQMTFSFPTIYSPDMRFSE